MKARKLRIGIRDFDETLDEAANSDADGVRHA